MKGIRCDQKMSIASALILIFLLSGTSAFAVADLNQQIDLLAKKLASVAKGDVVKGTETQVYISIGQKQGIQPGSKFEIIRQGEPLKIGDEIIGYDETRVAEVEVERVREKLSVCKIINKSDIPKNGDKAYQLRKKINTLVVGQFSYNQGFNRLTKSLQQKLVTAMANLGMRVVERDQLERVLKEQKLGYSGLINMSSAKKIGELLGAEGMLLGTISDMGNSITLNARLVDIESGNAVSASEVELPKTPLIAQLLEIPVEDKSFSAATPGTGSGDKKTKKKDKKKSAIQIVESGGFSIKLVGCKKSGGTVGCDLLITNNEQDRKLTMRSGDSRLFDTNGEVYPAERIRFANKKISSRTGLLSVRLIQGIPTKAGIWFSNLSSESEEAAVIEIEFSSPVGALQFRDVSFTR